MAINRKLVPYKTMSKYQILSIIFALALCGLAAGFPKAIAQEETPPAEVIVQTEEVTIADLEVAEPGLLPSSPFYFFKDFGRTIRKFFAFNPVKKIELELKFADEKLAETKKLTETAPQRLEALSRAIENYRRSQEELQARLEALRETSQNPNVDRLLEKLVDRTVKHEKLFAELKEKFSENAVLQQEFETAAERIEETATAAAKRDDPERFAGKLERALVEVPGSDLKHVRSVEILDRIHQKADPKLKEKLSDIREDFTERLKEDIEMFVTERGKEAPEALREALKKLPGDKARRLAILEELRERVEKQTKDALEDAADVLAEEVGKREELADRAEEAIRHARERVEKLAQAMRVVSAVPEAVTRLSREASAHLERAIAALGEKKFGEAFGQARAAEVNARNALRILERERPEGGELKDKITELERKLSAAEERMINLSPELQPKARESLEASRFHLRLATETLAKDESKEAKRHLEEAKSSFRNLERIFHYFRKPIEKREFPTKPERELPPQARPEPPPEAGIVCTQVYEPVCGVDGKMYSNACFARAAGVQIRHKGECGRPRQELKVEPAPMPSPPPAAPESAAPPAGEPVAFKLEADDSGFYPLRTLGVPKGTRVHLTFVVRKTNVYLGGLDFRSAKFKTESVKPGGSTAVEFTADEPFTITSYWPAFGVRKADLRVEVR